MTASDMGRYWDERAREDPFYFVDSRLSYGKPELERFWESGRIDLDSILDLLGAVIEPGDDVVEIGCGVGRISRQLAARGGTLRAIDVSPEMIALARAHNADLTNVEWLEGDGESLRPIPPASADVCFSHVVFQHIPDPDVTLGYVSEMGRVLRAGGWAAFQFSNAPEVHVRRPAIERLRAGLIAALGRGPRGLAHASWLGSAIELDQLERAAAGAGLTVERTVGVGTQFCGALLRKRTIGVDGTGDGGSG